MSKNKQRAIRVMVANKWLLDVILDGTRAQGMVKITTTKGGTPKCLTDWMRDYNCYLLNDDEILKFAKYLVWLNCNTGLTLDVDIDVSDCQIVKDKLI